MDTGLVPARSDRPRNIQTEACGSVAMYTHEQLLRKGFRLAYFIIGSEETAMEILGGAVHKLKKQRSRETKRVYWREKCMKRKITRIVRNETDALQWLIYQESTRYEKHQEQACAQDMCDMVIRYVKHLVQIATAMSSFYVNVGVQRLLYSYSTSEAQKAYEWVTEHYSNNAVYRAIKGSLMTDLERRFETSVRICRIHRGERKFEVLEDQQRWAVLVERCLRVFTPWSTLRDCFASEALDFSGGGILAAKRHPNLTQDVLEVRRCHAFIDPVCYGNILRKAGLGSSRQRLAVPRFFNARDKGPDDSARSVGERKNLTEDNVSYIIDRRIAKKLVDYENCLHGVSAKYT